MNEFIFAFSLLASVSLVAENQDSRELMASCVKNHPGITEAGCDCLVKEILSNKKIEKMLKKMKKRFGSEFEQKILADLKSG